MHHSVPYVYAANSMFMPVASLDGGRRVAKVKFYGFIFQNVFPHMYEIKPSCSLSCDI